MKQKTAVDWLEEEVSQILDWDLIELFKEAKVKEKENLLKFYKLGRACADCDETEFEKFFETCYKDTFEQ
jgi:hypothetical protein